MGIAGNVRTIFNDATRSRKFCDCCHPEPYSAKDLAWKWEPDPSPNTVAEGKASAQDDRFQSLRYGRSCSVRWMLNLPYFERTSDCPGDERDAGLSREQRTGRSRR